MDYPETATGFYQPDDIAVCFPFWAKMGSWESDQAASIIMGVNPDYVSEGKLQDYAGDQKAKLFSLCDLTSNAIISGQVDYPLSPANWLAWAKVYGIPVYPELEEAIIRWSRPAEAERHEKRSLGKQISPDKPLGTRERETMLKIIIGLAIKGYYYEPKASRSDKIKEIESDLLECGLSVSDDTIRKYLREGAELLPPQEEC